MNEYTHPLTGNPSTRRRKNMTEKEFEMQRMENEIVEARKVVLSYIGFAASRVRTAQQLVENNIHDSDLLSNAASAILDISRNALDLQKAVARLEALTEARRLL